MKVFVITATAVFALVYSLAAVAQVDIVEQYQVLFDLCKSAGNDSYVGVRYADGSEVTYDYEECYPYTINGTINAELAVFCKPVTCVSHPNPDCTGGDAPPVGVPVPAGVVLDNVDDFASLLGQGATCEPNGALFGL